MARIGMRIFLASLRKTFENAYKHPSSSRFFRSRYLISASVGVGGSYILYNVLHSSGQVLSPIKAAEKKENVFEKQKISMRERRFRAFASLEYDDEIYMSPQDFLESVTQDVPRYRKRRKVLSKMEVNDFLKNTPTKWRGSQNLFRRMGDQGIISYTEYLFLLCVLTKPKSGFEIAFNMFDTDMNQRVDRSEFLVMERVMQARRNEQAGKTQDVPADAQAVRTSPSSDSKSGGFLGDLMNKLMTNRLVRKANIDTSELNDAEQPFYGGPDEDDSHFQDTTLLRHFFGRKGNDRLTFEEFCKFMENLQTEALELEFTEYSKGLQTISESEFARILLRYTKVQTDDYDLYIDKIKNRLTREEISAERGIPFDEFKKFFQFLNNLDDFTMAMRMYTLADRPISQQEFQRAVKACVDYTLHPHLVETVFVVFDQDGDGHLSYHEFVCIMKDRLARGLSTTRNSAPNRWEAYRHCVRDVMREKS